jgi:hypothetical protein
MEGYDFVWLASIILGMTVLGWLVLDWLESAQNWESYDVEPDSNIVLGRSEHPTPDALDVEMELMLCYPLDPFAPALLWRPLPQDQWIEVQEAINEHPATEQLPTLPTVTEQTPAPRPSEAA